jgi:hypothetical protein
LGSCARALPTSQVLFVTVTYSKSLPIPVTSRIVRRVIINLAEEIEESRLLVAPDIFDQRSGHGRPLGAVVADTLRFGDE